MDQSPYLMDPQCFHLVSSGRIVNDRLSVRAETETIRDMTLTAVSSFSPRILVSCYAIYDDTLLSAVHIQIYRSIKQ